MSKTIMLGHNLVLIHVLDCSRCFIRTLFHFKKCRITPNIRWASTIEIIDNVYYFYGFHAEGLTYDGRLYTKRILCS